MAQTTLSTRKYDKDGFTVIVERILDEDPDLSYLTQDYILSQLRVPAPARRPAAGRQGSQGHSAALLRRENARWSEPGVE